MAAAAKVQGVLDAADRLADVVMRAAGLSARGAEAHVAQEQAADEPEPKGTAGAPPAQVAQ
jgi:hypothetical protein